MPKRSSKLPARVKLAVRGPRALAAGLLLASLALPGVASAAVVERVVAVVGEQAILLSDLRARARPVLLRVYQSTPAGAQRAAASGQVYKEVLERMVDDELQRRAANQARITVSAQEIDDAMARVARQNRITVEKLISEATGGGLTLADYRAELRRQLLEAKLLNLRIAGRIRVTEPDLRSSYRRIVLEERRKLSFRIAWIHIPAGEHNSPERQQQQRLARQVAAEAKTGDFAQLAARHSADAATRAQGGLLPPQLPSALPRELARAVLELEVGQVAEPIRVADAFVIVKLVEREESELPTFDEAKEQLYSRVYMEKMGKARDQWLRSLRSRTHVEVRL